MEETGTRLKTYGGDAKTQFNNAIKSSYKTSRTSKDAGSIQGNGKADLIGRVRPSEAEQKYAHGDQDERCVALRSNIAFIDFYIDI